MDWSIHRLVGGRPAWPVAVELRHRHLLPADAGARPARPARSPRTLGVGLTAPAGRGGAGRRRRGRWPGTCSARSGRAEPPASANRDVNLDIGERVHVDAWAADGTATRAATAARAGRRVPRRRRAGAPASTWSREVDRQPRCVVDKI